MKKFFFFSCSHRIISYKRHYVSMDNDPIRRDVTRAIRYWVVSVLILLLLHPYLCKTAHTRYFFYWWHYPRSRSFSDVYYHAKEKYLYSITYFERSPEILIAETDQTYAIYCHRIVNTSFPSCFERLLCSLDCRIDE